MLVNEHRHDTTAGTENFKDFFPEAAFWVLRIARGRFGVIPMLGNEQYAVHGQLAFAEGERIFDRFARAKAMGSSEPPAHVIGWTLIRVKGNQLERRGHSLVIQRIRAKQPADD